MMSKTKKQYRNSQRYRHRLVWSVRMNSLNALEFRRRYRLSKILFQRLITKMRPHYSKVERSIDIEPDLKLSMMIRMLAGGAPVDIADILVVKPRTWVKFVKLTENK